ncbi:ABC transporter substrate-binding protein [Thermoleophilia bacterium SCSIO 60948]|nr:ABC transporter substrate-binding protein [Thermoleophilia bacterium SCSIO 60948]
MAAAVVVLPACGGSDAGEGGQSIGFYVFNDPSGAYQDAADACTKQSNGRYTIQIEPLPTDASQQRELLVRRLGAGDTSIDLMGMDVIWTSEFANAGWLAEWAPDDAEQVTKNTFDSVIDSASFEDQLYAAPFTSNTQLLWYRKDRVPKPPKTWDEMIDQAEKIGGAEGRIGVQASFYEGYTTWVNSLIVSAGGEILSGPETVSLEEKPTSMALEVIGRLANSSAAQPDIDTSNEDSVRLAFQGGDLSFMVNYPFVYPSAKAEAPDVFKQMEAAKYPTVAEGVTSAPPLGGINVGVSAYSDNQELAFEAATCLVSPENQINAAEVGGLPPTDQTLYENKALDKAYPGFADLIKQSIDDAAPRPLTPAYTDVSLAIQRALSPPRDIDPDDVKPKYDELYEYVEAAVKREGLL